MSTDELITRQKELSRLENQIAGFESEWLETSEKLEEMEK